MSLDNTVLIAISDWDDHVTGHAVTYAKDVALAVGEEVGKVARVVDRLAKGGYIDAHNVTTMGSDYPEYMITGVTSYGQQVAEQARAGSSPRQSGPVTINVYGTVGNLNTGQVLGNINANLSVAIGASADELRLAVKKIVEEVESAQSIDDRVKAEILENFEALSAQAAAAPEDRKSGIIRSLLGGIADALQVTSGTVAAWQQYGPGILKFFGH